MARAMNGFQQHARHGDVLIFAPEVLAPSFYYARVFDCGRGGLKDESDRDKQTLLARERATAFF